MNIWLSRQTSSVKVYNFSEINHIKELLISQVFTHNDIIQLESILRVSIAEGQPRTHRPWKKILIVVEGIYSMEGEMCRLAEIVELKKRYKVSLQYSSGNSSWPAKHDFAKTVSKINLPNAIPSNFKKQKTETITKQVSL